MTGWVASRWNRLAERTRSRADALAARSPFAARILRWPHWHHFLLNLLIGFAIEIVLHMMLGGALVNTVRNAVEDGAVNLAAHMPGPSTRSSPEIAIFDVDDETWRSEAWGGGEPDTAPRPALARLIGIAADAGARTIVVDVIVEDPAKAEDARFAAEMAPLGQRLRPDQHILFVRSIRNPLCAGEGEACPDAGAPTLRGSVLDDVIRRSGGRLINVAPNFLVSPDGVLRGWTLWKPACEIAVAGSPGKWRALPSVQLAVLELERARQAGPAHRWTLPNRDFGACIPTAPTGPRNVQGALTLEAVEGRIAGAVLPGLTASHGKEAGHEGGGHPDPGHGFGHADPGHGFGHADPGSVVLFRYAQGTGSVAAGGNGIETLSARTLLEGRVPAGLEGKLVILSQSHEVARDHHLTPLGRLSGAMVLANSINSLRDPGVIEHAPGALEYGFALFSIVLAAWLFAVVRGEFALLLAIGFVPVLLGVSWLALTSGIRLGSEIALLGIYLHWLFKTIEHALAAGRSHDRAHTRRQPSSHSAETQPPDGTVAE